jgi:hypothetical protein
MYRWKVKYRAARPQAAPSGRKPYQLGGRRSVRARQRQVFAHLGRNTRAWAAW